MPAVAKKGKAADDEVIHGTKSNITKQKDLKKQMKKAAIQSSELVTDSSDMSDPKMNMDIVKETSDPPIVKESPSKDRKALYIQMPFKMDTKNAKELLAAIEDGSTPINEVVTLGFDHEDDARAAQERLNRNKLVVDGKTVKMQLIEGLNKNKKSLEMELPWLMEMEEVRQFLPVVEASESSLFSHVKMFFKKEDDARAAQNQLNKMNLNGEQLQTMLFNGTDKKSLFVEMPDLMEVENAKQFLSAIEASSTPVFKNVAIVHKEHNEAIETQKRFSEAKIEGEATHVDFEHIKTPPKDKKSLFMMVPDAMEIENCRQLLTAVETTINPLFFYFSIVHNKEEDAKSTHERLSKVEIDGSPLVLEM